MAHTLTAIVLLLGSLAFVSLPSWSQVVNGQSLVGDWNGQWTFTSDQGAESTGEYVL